MGIEDVDDVFIQCNILSNILYLFYDLIYKLINYIKIIMNNYRLKLSD